MDLKIRLRVLQIVEPKLGHGLAMAHSWLNKITWLRLCDAFPRAKRVHRELLRPPIIAVDAIKASSPNPPEPQTPDHSCPCCGGRMIIIERFERGATPRSHSSPPTPVIRIDTS